MVPTGYTIPADWIVLVIPSLVHFDPEIYDNPFEFNPWRWEVLTVTLVYVKITYIIFIFFKS